MSFLHINDPIWIATPDDLLEMTAELEGCSQIAVDTESNSLYAYYEQVCLVQLSTREQDYIIDPLAMDDISPLGTLCINCRTRKMP